MKGLLRDYINIFKNSEFLRSVSVLVSGQLFSQFITLITIPIVSRLFTEKAYGEFAIFASTANIILGIGAMGLSSAIMAPKELQRSREVFFTAFAIEMAVFSLFFVVALFIAPFFHFYNISIPYIVAIVLCYLYMVLSGFSLLLSTYVNRLKRNRVLFWNSVISGSCILLITIPLGYIGLGALGFIIAGICGSLAADIQMLIKINPFQRILSFKEMASVCKEFKEYILFQFPSNLTNTFVVQLPNQLFSSFFGNSALGGYAMSDRVLGYPLRLMASPIGTIYFRHATDYVHKGRINDLGEFNYSFITKILKIAFFPTVLFMIFSEPLFRFMLGSKWETAGLIASILAIQYVFRFCSQCTTSCLVVLDKQRVNLVFSIINLLVIGASIGTGIILFENIKDTIFCFAIGSTIVQMLSISIDFYYLGTRVSKFIPPLLLFSVGAAGLTISGRFLMSFIF
jgi:lipopolysaccharide exporter